MNTIEMGLLWMEIKYLKSAVTLFVPCPLVGLSNEVLKNLVPQGATELPEVKLEMWKKDPGLDSSPLVRGSN